MGKDKQIRGGIIPPKKEVAGYQAYSSDSMRVVWLFDKLDKSGAFAFDTSRDDFDHEEVLEKIIAYSNMTWAEVKQATHDKGKSKHHFLEPEKLSKEARQRLEVKRLTEDVDAIFSFALQNKLRLIGLRDHEKFHVIWYDSEHKFCPSTKK